MTVENSKKDANDYSRFENIPDDEDDEVERNDKTASKQDNILALLHKATSQKDAGNTYFKENKHRLAKESYEDALLTLSEFKEVKAIEALPTAMASDMKTLVTSLYSNLAMIAIKEESWYKALTHANNALKFDVANVKVLYRRAVAHAKLDAFDEAKEDLQKCLELEPTNAAAKKELQEVAKKIKVQKQKEKASFSNIFNKGSVYDDREQERLEKAKIREEELKKEQEEWKKSNEKRVSEGLEEETFEDWKKNKDTFSSSSDDENDKDDKKKKKVAKSSSKDKSSSSSSSNKLKEEVKKETPPSLNKPLSSSSGSNKKEKSSDEKDDDVEYDEEEAKLIAETKAKGYCYFRNNNLAPRDFTPKAVSTPSPTLSSPEADAATTQTDIASSTPIPESKEAASAQGVTASSWNYAGTWEERDMTEFVKTQLTERCQQVKDISPVNNNLVTASITKVNKIEGEASIVMTRGKKRRLYDFQLKLDFEVQIAEDGQEESKRKSIKGSLSFSDVSPQSSLDYSLSWKKSATDESFKKEAQTAIAALYQAVAEQIRNFEAEYCNL